MRFKVIFLAFALLCTPFATVSAQEDVLAQVTTQVLEVYNPISFEKEGEILLPSVFEDISYQIADMGADGQAELIVGASAGQDPEVLFLRKDGSEIRRLSIYTPAYRGGVLVETSDVNNDGSTDIITGTREGGGPHIKVLTSSGELLSEFFAFEADYTGGVTLAVGDVADSFGGKEILVAKAEGYQTILRIFSFDGTLISEWYPFGEDFLGGVNLDVSPTGQILVSRAFGKSPLVRVMNRFGGLEAELMAYYDEFPGGVQAQAVSNQNGGWDIFTVPGFTGGPHIVNFNTEGRQLSPGFMAFGGEFKGGLVIEEGDIDGDGQVELIVGKDTLGTGPHTTVKSIIVDLSDQTLTTFFRGKEQTTYFISSGLARFATPTGEFSITRKRELTRMAWVYGPEHPDNYDLPDVPHAMTFVGPYNIHGAYWHNNFGTPMSHGCVNMSLPDAEELFNWTDMGTTVIVQE